MKILYVAYSLVPVGADSCGGAEQMLHAVEQGMARRGHETVLAACRGSHAAGSLIATCEADGPLDSFAERNAAHNARVLQILRSERLAGCPFDLVHDQSGTFWSVADAIPEPVLMTAHLPREFYGPALASAAPNVFINCVSTAQAGTFDDVPNVIGVVPNGIALHRFPLRERKGDYLLWLGRICEEKGPHVAIDIARRAGRRLVLAGDVYSFSYHHKFFEREVLRRMKDDVQLVIRPSFAKKVDLIANARAVLIPSRVDETSSLIGMEAAACGTPVIAFRRGALPEIVEDGRTGYVVDSETQMADAVARAHQIDPRECRRHADVSFDGDKTVLQYEAFYWRTLRSHRQRNAVAA